MIDKAEQRRRAEEMSRNLAAQGLKAPVLPMPIITKRSLAAPVAAKKSTSGCKFDCAGQMLNVGDTVATTVDGYVSKLVVGKITSFAPKKVCIDVPAKPGSREARNGLTEVSITKFPEQVAKLSL